jgi:hypothetical protein
VTDCSIASFGCAAPRQCGSCSTARRRAGRAVEGQPVRALHAGGHDRRRADPAPRADVPLSGRGVASSDRSRGRRAPARRQRDLRRAAARRQLNTAVSSPGGTAPAARSRAKLRPFLAGISRRFRSRGSRFVSIPVRASGRGIVRRSRERPSTGRTGNVAPLCTLLVWRRSRSAATTASCETQRHATTVS